MSNYDWNSRAYFGYTIPIQRSPELLQKYHDVCSLDKEYKERHSFGAFFGDELRRRRLRDQTFSIVGLLPGVPRYNPQDDEWLESLVVGKEIKDGDDLRSLQVYLTELQDSLPAKKWPELLGKKPEIYSGVVFQEDWSPPPLPVDRWVKAYGWDLSNLSPEDKKAWWELEFEGYDMKGFIDLKDGRRLSFGILAWRKERFAKMIDQHVDHPFFKIFSHKPIEEFWVQDDFGDSAYDSDDEFEDELPELSDSSE